MCADYRSDSTPYEGPLFQSDVIGLRRELGKVIPPSRAIDAQDVLQLIAGGNQTSRANIFRERLAYLAARQALRSLILTDAELEEAIAFVRDLSHNARERFSLVAKLDSGPIADAAFPGPGIGDPRIDDKPSAHLEKRARELFSSAPGKTDHTPYAPGLADVPKSPDGTPAFTRTANP